ncbi:NblA-related protein [filamentous cyanobacterium CCP5]|nr:NblA-related protein [filamentous cyanobacterium CCP5]
MDIRQQLTLEQQFELQVFETQVQELSIEQAQDLLVQLRGSMMYQKAAFREILRESWGIGKGPDGLQELLAEG